MFIFLRNVFIRSFVFLRVRKKDRIESVIVWVLFKSKSLTVCRTQILFVLFSVALCCGRFRPS